ncbi:MAG: hypothetical protein ACREF3_04005 [Acetobacteraceae bacterium]
MIAAALLLWPAAMNGYPLVFSDTGTYLSQAIQHYLGWDRPAFYSIFMLPLHMTVTTWPVVVVQALLAAHMMHLVRRVLRPDLPAVWLLPLAAIIAVATALPMFASELMPDLFTSLMVLAIAMLVLCANRLSHAERVWLIGFSAFCMAAHLSNLPLGLGLLLLLIPFRRRLGAASRIGRAWLGGLAAAPALAAMALVGMNAAGHGVPSLAPFGNVFLLARVLYDGPGMDVLARDCPHPGWRLCSWRGQFPSNADGFLWQPDSPLYRAGGPKKVSIEADAIITAALREEPERELATMIGDGMRQLTLFRTGDGLQPWPATVTPWIDRDFPLFESTAYHHARQTEGRPILPWWMPEFHAAAAVAGLAACFVMLPRALHRRDRMAGFIVAMMIALVANAFITGGLSGPHARYQSRLMWLPSLLALLAVPIPVRLLAVDRSVPNVIASEAKQSIAPGGDELPRPAFHLRPSQ